MRHKAIFRLQTEVGTIQWIHCSRKDNTVILRSLPFPETETELEWIKTAYRLPNDQQRLDRDLAGAREFALAEIAARTEDVLDVSADKLSVDDVDKWSQVFGRLEEPGMLDRPPEPRSPRTQSGSRPTSTAPDAIPQTRMRRFYETLRVLNVGHLQEDIVNYFSEETEERWRRLDIIFGQSIKHFSRYSNTEAFRPRRSASRHDQYRHDPNRFALCLAARLAAFRIVLVDGESPREIQFVDDEISPFRTTGGASFEDTTTGTSGGGGVDLLLGDRDGSLLIGEVKAPGDSTLFLALIQSLTYAIELTTASQMLRLKTCYPNAYAGLQSHDEGQGCRCDILLIYGEGDNPKLLDQSQALARQLLRDPGSAIARKVRRFDFVTASLLDDGGLRLRCVFSTGDNSEVDFVRS
jgi:hypothetical protein